MGGRKRKGKEKGGGFLGRKGMSKLSTNRRRSKRTGKGGGGSLKEIKKRNQEGTGGEKTKLYATGGRKPDTEEKAEVDTEKITKKKGEWGGGKKNQENGSILARVIDQSRKLWVGHRKTETRRKGKSAGSPK